MSDRDLFREIQMLYPQLSPAKQRVAQYLIEHWRDACFMSAAQLGKAADVSESAVIRFAQDLGFQGYPMLQDELRQAMNRSLTLIGRLDQASVQSEPVTLVDKVLEADLNNVRAIMVDNTLESLNKAVEMIARANRIGVISYGPTSSLSVYLAFNLNQCLNNAYHIDLGMGDWLNRTRQFGPDDLAIGISFPRYSRNVLDMFEVAKKRGAKGLAISDSVVAPIARMSDHTLSVKTEGVSFHRTLSAGISLINILLALLAVKEKDRVRASLEDLDQLLDSYRSGNRR